MIVINSIKIKSKITSKSIKYKSRLKNPFHKNKKQLLEKIKRVIFISDKLSILKTNFRNRYMNQMRKTIDLVNKLLIEKYGIPPRSKVPPNPVDLLIGTILSQNTNDKNSYKAFQNLKNSYKDWNEVEHITRAQIENKIKVAGLGKQKSGAIKQFLSSLKKVQGSISLEHLRKSDDKKILDELTSYNGIGVKTASCVLLFSLRRNVCPVDTHVHRTTNRIGIVKTKTPDKTFEIINSDLPEGTAHSFHTNLIRLGREICRPTKPSCSICPLLNVCEFENKNLDGEIKYKENDFLLLDSIK